MKANSDTPEPVAEVVLNANLEPTLAILHDAELPIGAKLYLAPPEREREALVLPEDDPMVRDHEAMEKLRCLGLVWRVENYASGEVSLGEYELTGRVSEPTLSDSWHHDPADAILADGGDEG